MGVILRFADYRARRRLAGVELRLVRTERPWPLSAPRMGKKIPVELRRDGPFPLAASPWRAPANDPPEPGDDQS